MLWLACEIRDDPASGQSADDICVGCSGRVGKGAAFLVRVLQFMETPQYLRK